MVRRLATPLVTLGQPAQVQLLDDFNNEATKMVIRQPFIDQGRQQVLLRRLAAMNRLMAYSGVLRG